MKYRKETRYFKFTKAGIADYKKNDPLKTARNPRRGYLAFQWDINWAFSKWILTVIFLICAFGIDLILLPFQVLGRITEPNEK